jgi:hypothetical protein
MINITKLSERLELNRSMQYPSKVSPTNMEIAEFEKLFQFLASSNAWGRADYDSWLEDFTIDKKCTLGCLRALKNSWTNNRFGYLVQEDWNDDCLMQW